MKELDFSYLPSSSKPFFTPKAGMEEYVSVPRPGTPQGAKAKIGTKTEAPDPNNNVSDMAPTKKVAKGSEPALSAKSKKRSLTRFNNHFVMKKKGKKGK